ncbi:MAG: cyclic lactone autoinducer peptide [Vallitaleaceae bacterium]|nr:cyclic lactone autoinducer peptide [Vallitaleaceae bacterium]
MSKKRQFTTFSSLLCSLLIAIAPLIVSTTACILVWGEPECPDVLKSL